MKKEFLLCALLLALVQWSNAQTVKLYSSTGVLKNTYTSVGAAIVASVDGDSLLMSPHVFKESFILSFKRNIILQGTISAKDTSTIDANSNGSCFGVFYGTIRDVILTGGRPVGSRNGGAIGQFQGILTGNTTIRDNIGVYNIIAMSSGNINSNVKIVNNTTLDPSSAILIYQNSTLIDSTTFAINGNILISGNKGGIAVISFASGFSDGDTALSKSKMYLKISGNVIVENNECSKSGFILMRSNLGYLEIDGASIINNKVTNSYWGVAISVDTNYSSGSSKPYDSIGVPLIRLHNVRIYNPLSSGARQTEIFMHNRRYTTTSYKPGYFYSDACWWGNSDTTGLFQLDTGTYFSMPTWAVTQWSATPFGTALSNVRSQMKLNTGAALPSNSLSGLQANFWATAGTFSAPTATINASNYLASDYYFPTSGSYKVYAAIDADTFKPSTKALGIPYLPNNQFVFSISPNPSNGKLVISDASLQGKQSESLSIKVYDLLGRVVYEQSLILTKVQTPLELNLAKGTYILELRTEEAVQRERIVITE